jgi:ankyrin repeat protein
MSSSYAGIYRLAAIGDKEELLVALNEGVPVDAKDKRSGHTLLWIAASSGHLEIVKLLITLGADPGLAVEGLTASQAAMRNCHPHVTYYLKCQKDYFSKVKCREPRRIALLIGNQKYNSLDSKMIYASQLRILIRLGSLLLAYSCSFSQFIIFPRIKMRI